MSWADQTQKQVDSAEIISEAEKMALYKRCEEDPDWCEKRKNVENSDDENCIDNFVCEKTQKQEKPITQQVPQAIETQTVEEKWCTDNPEICQRLKANTEKLHDLQRQIDDLRQTLHQRNTDQTTEKFPKIETSATDQ